MNAKLLVVGLIAVTFIGCSKPVKPSVLITDAEILRKFNAEALPKNYNVIVRLTNWNLDGVKGRFERSFACSVMSSRHGRVLADGVVEMDNASFDPHVVSDRFEAWLPKLVKVASAETTDAGRVIRYTTKQTTGELRYTIKPVPDAKLTVNGEKMPGNWLEFDVRIVEEKTQQ